MAIACSDCEFCAALRDGTFCQHPQSRHTRTDYYSGVEYTASYTDAGMRTLGPCKPEALLFVPDLDGSLRRAIGRPVWKV